MCAGSGRAWVANLEVGWCPVGFRDEHRMMPASQHPLLSVSQGRLIVGNVVPVPAQEPDESTPVTWVEALLCCIVVHQGHGVGELVTCLALGPFNDLKDIGVENVVGSSPAVGGTCVAAVKVDTEARCGQLPGAVALVDGEDMHAVESTTALH